MWLGSHGHNLLVLGAAYFILAMMARFGRAVAGRCAWRNRRPARSVRIRRSWISLRFFDRLSSASHHLKVHLISGPLFQLDPEEDLSKSLAEQCHCTDAHSHEDHVGRGEFGISIEDPTFVQVLYLGEFVRVAELAHEDDRENALQNHGAEESFSKVSGGGLIQLPIYFSNSFWDFVCLRKTGLWIGRVLDTTESLHLGMKDNHVDLKAYEQDCKG